MKLLSLHLLVCCWPQLKGRSSHSLVFQSCNIVVEVVVEIRTGVRGECGWSEFNSSSSSKEKRVTERRRE
uniref:Secreted protein n=1 Tax=Octopus bimaculoides TaxID=37653 RepID=A0A0L8G2D8_OCTBM